MVESLDEMVKNEKQSDSDNEINEKKESVEETNNNEKEETSITINTTNLSEWFQRYVKLLGENSGIKGVRGDIKYVDSNKNLIITIPDYENKERNVWAFRTANTLSVLDLEPSNMMVFENNSFEVDYKYNDILIKTYNLKNRLVVIPSYINSDLVIPYNRTKIKSNVENVSISYNFNKSTIDQLLNQKANMDEIMLRYKQIKKHKDNLITNYDVINFLNKKQSEIYDTNHLIQIDDAIIGIVSDT